MTDQRPKPPPALWKRVVSKADRLITPPSNAFVRTELFTDIVTTTTRLDQRVRRTLERRSRQTLHMLNLPAASDLRRVFTQLSALEARVRDLQEGLDHERQETISTWRQRPGDSTPSAKTSNARSSARRTASGTRRASASPKSE
jgi:hypothetical protein